MHSYTTYPEGDGNYRASERNSHRHQFYGFKVSDNIADAVIYNFRSRNDTKTSFA
ncbi:hypothetical protein ACR78G_07025 [Sphingobacterium spiritivorum]|uniref:hypothetical protein n=1 Tax=Sphingobacterium spiritivorum TaxID=258 RepID=UPI003DA3786B